jgi:hypothetical protein
MIVKDRRRDNFINYSANLGHARSSYVERTLKTQCNYIADERRALRAFPDQAQKKPH